MASACMYTGREGRWGNSYKSIDMHGSREIYKCALNRQWAVLLAEVPGPAAFSLTKGHDKVIETIF